LLGAMMLSQASSPALALYQEGVVSHICVLFGQEQLPRAEAFRFIPSHQNPLRFLG
jgi:hypothetical protein